jgi:hypothetical protein
MSQVPQAAFNMASLLPPYQEINLPSNGYFDSEIPATINVRGLTIKELKFITANGKLNKKSFDSTLSACIKESIDLSKLLVEDYNYIVYMIRLFSNGGHSTATMRCNNISCRQQYSFDYDITECAVVDRAEQLIEKTKTVTLPRFKKEHNLDVNIEVKRLTRSDIINVENTMRIQAELCAREKRPNSVFPLTEYLKAYVVSISGFPIPIPKEQLLDVFSAEDSQLVTTAFDDVVFGVRGQADSTCPHCGEANKYDIPFTDAFFL